MLFPSVDPIPIPAPVWLMKALSLLTLALHFFAVEILIGSLVAVAYLSFKGQAKRDQAALTAASVVGKRLPIVMTYVINLGVPPLLFAQVLYGRALYTSSVLMAVMWISVVFLVMGLYYALYRISDRTALGKSAGWHALLALVLAAGVGQILSFNMTLMLRPEVWQAMYANTATGFQIPPHDPTLMPRWSFIMVGGLMGGGLWIALNSNLKNIEDATRQLLKKTGTGMAVAGALIQVACVFMVYHSQPENVQKGLASPFYMAGAGLTVLGLVLVLLLSALHLTRKTPSLFLGWAAPVGLFLSICGAVIARDGIRDITLMAKGFDVWKRTEVSNWGVIAVFLILFVIGLGVCGWLLSVMKQAKPMGEEVKA